MTTEYTRAHSYLSRLFEEHDENELAKRLEPKGGEPADALPRGTSAQDVDARWRALAASPQVQGALLDEQTLAQHERYRRNIENFIGTVKLPVGVVGPLRVNGLFAQGDYFLPLATTEAALVASYTRGAQLISAAGGATTLLLNEGVSRAPGFAFKNLIEVGRFLKWATAQFPVFKTTAESTTGHGKLVGMKVTIEGNHVYLNFDYTTGDAAGQNMVTIATQAICDYIEQHSPITPQYGFVEANLSGDKKATTQSFQSVRGKKVTAEVTVPAALIEKRLHTTPTKMVHYWRMSGIGGVLSGSIGIQGHYANGLAALYIACGQDAACVAESAVGVTRFEVIEDGALYAAVTLPNLIVGTVGGGTGLPSQRACLELLKLAGPGHAQALAELCAGLCLAGELSIIGALCSGDFTRAHQVLSRGRKSDVGRG